METLKQVLMGRDNLTEEEANKRIQEARKDLLARLESGDYPDEFMEEEFDLEPDYLFEIL